MKYTTAQHRRAEGRAGSYVWATRSAAIAFLDPDAVAVLDEFTGGRDAEAWMGADEASKERRQSFDALAALGLLEPAEFALPLTPDLPAMPFPLGTLVLNVTNKCNLSCTYCYEYGEDRIATPDSKGPALMSAETARGSVDLLFNNSAGRRNVSLTFFGGETLLNFPVIRETVEYAETRARAEGRRVSFALTTNATLLSEEVITFLTQHHFGVNISIDGPRETHDAHRAFASGKGSHAMIVPKIRALIEANRAAKGRPIGARVTVTAHSQDVRGIHDHLVNELGFDSVGFAPVTSAPGRDYALSGENYWTLLRGFSELADDFVAAAIANRHHAFSNLNDVLRELHHGVNKAHPCGAGLGLLGVSTAGEIGLCHRFVESGRHEVGSLSRGIDEDRRKAFLEAGHISTKVVCHTCFARPLCSGGCYHEAQVRYNDASQPNLHSCEWIRAFMDLGLQSYARIMDENPAFFARYEESA
ncbi:MAG: quinohemoprotein amine dehydrogenase maturation protein [Planctomycetes bacterium]|nr:quinohemoprotein amine dehydrogenase maturation protein [Planctomycetota bacterium]